jgi:lysophospholipase L1-like esterase
VTLLLCSGVLLTTCRSQPSSISTDVPYVALGDSYTSGPKIAVQDPHLPGCARSSRNYPALIANKLRITNTDFHDMSCSGARLVNLTTPQPTSDGVNPAQLSALSSATRLVTIGIGGNDIGFQSLVTSCVAAGAFYRMLGSQYMPDDGPCRRRYLSGGIDQIHQRIEAVGLRLAAQLSEAKHRAPEARVYIVGYPAVLPAGGDCMSAMSLAPGDVTFLHQELLQLNAMLRHQAEVAAVGYVDTYAPSLGHDACSDRGSRWIEPLRPDVPAAAVHPNERGERGMADAVLDAIKNSS